MTRFHFQIIVFAGILLSQCKGLGNGLEARVHRVPVPVGAVDADERKAVIFKEEGSEHTLQVWFRDPSKIASGKLELDCVVSYYSDAPKLCWLTSSPEKCVVVVRSKLDTLKWFEISVVDKSIRVKEFKPTEEDAEIAVLRIESLADLAEKLPEKSQDGSEGEGGPAKP